MKDHSVIFLGSEPMKDKRVATRVLSYFTVPADRLPKRILLSFMPPLRSAPLVHVDFLGPCLAFVLLASILGYGHANKTPSAVYHRSPAQVLAMYCLSMPVVCYSLIRLGKSSITLLQISSLLGYSLYGYVFTLICTALLSDETNNTIFYLSTILFTGPSVLRICLLILLTIELPAARLLVCSAIAVIQVLFVVFLYFTFVHSSFAFVKH